MSNRKSIVGRRFGKWVVLSLHGSQDKTRVWLCRCDCGREKLQHTGSLTSGRSKSCSACNPRNTRHGLSEKRTWNSWNAMRDRCTNRNHDHFADYGGRGITICDEWMDSFEAFLSDMGERPDGTTLDRKDNDGNYEPGNCRWATASEQLRNKRNNRLMTFGGVTKCVVEWADELGIDPNVLYCRLHGGWSDEKALTTAVSPILLTISGVTRTISEWAAHTGVSESTIRGRLERGASGSKSISPPFQAKTLTLNGVTHTIAEWSSLRGIKVITIRKRIARGATVEEALSVSRLKRST